ncbi:GntR family transcriptional regulator [Lachnoclostridium edouardi]|uniref:GntR family transcriptional regulator n=1 Tax=Lachnoclostridium edouardi TaxID=1926283 RepID=UPI0015E0BEF2|nr:GntR family transcriptional regulator [Lachnoclostridium edouardi]
MFKNKNISDFVYEKILEGIVQLKYAPGEKISENKLAESLGVSRAPIKNALAKLEKGGYVIIRPQYGTFVMEISAERTRQICDVRLSLEVQAIKAAVHAVTEEQLAKLEVRFQTIEGMAEDTDEKREYIYLTDSLLHQTIYQASGNEIIPEIMDRYSPEIQRLQRANMTWRDRGEGTLAEMKKIFQALKDRNLEGAVQAMEEHISNIKAAIK